MEIGSVPKLNGWYWMYEPQDKLWSMAFVRDGDDGKQLVSACTGLSDGVDVEDCAALPDDTEWYGPILCPESQIPTILLGREIHANANELNRAIFCVAADHSSARNKIKDIIGGEYQAKLVAKTGHADAQRLFEMIKQIATTEKEELPRAIAAIVSKMVPNVAATVVLLWRKNAELTDAEPIVDISSCDDDGEKIGEKLAMAIGVMVGNVLGRANELAEEDDN